MKANERDPIRVDVPALATSAPAGGKWKELGGGVSAYLRIGRDGRVDLMAHLQGPQEIRRLCRELEQRLLMEREVQLTRRQERLAERGLAPDREAEPELFAPADGWDGLTRSLSTLPILRPISAPEESGLARKSQPVASKRPERPGRRKGGERQAG